MPRELNFALNNERFSAAPARIDRSRLYGWSEIVALDAQGTPCRMMSTDDSGRWIIPRGGTGLGLLDTEGRWVERSQLQAVNPDGSPAPLMPSIFEQTVELDRKVTIEELFDHDITDLYALDGASAFLEAVGEAIYAFSYCYAGRCAARPAFLMAAGAESQRSLFLLVGRRNRFELLGLRDSEELPALPDEEEDEGEALDFSLFWP